MALDLKADLQKLPTELKAHLGKHWPLYTAGIGAAGLVVTWLIYKQGQNPASVTTSSPLPPPVDTIPLPIGGGGDSGGGGGGGGGDSGGGGGGGGGTFSIGQGDPSAAGAAVANSVLAGFNTSALAPIRQAGANVANSVLGTFNAGRTLTYSPAGAAAARSVMTAAPVIRPVVSSGFLAALSQPRQTLKNPRTLQAV